MLTPAAVDRAVARMLRGEEGLWLADGAPPVGWRGDGAVVQTSGSAGASKHVVLSRRALVAAAEATTCWLGGAATWHLALAPRYVAGLMVLVRGRLGAGLRFASSGLSDLDPTPGPNAISVVPTQLYRAVRHPGTAAMLARFDAVLVGGAALAPELRARAEERGIRVVETYGMSETCGGIVYDGHPLPGATVRTVPDDRAPRGYGRVVLGGPTLFDGYLGEPDLTAEVLVDGGLHTGDWGRVERGSLVVGGRLDDVVVTGGVNIDVALVRAAAARLDPDTDVIAVPDDEWGARIVLAATAGDLASWRERLGAELPRPALPRQLLVLPALPRTAGGKPDRATLRRLARESAGPNAK
ncbi:MAG TPA: AMP-binding protein [Arachnia sp.]|nr:AMP-binding protein [Arachnia sp.]HMT85860.1 AMP-binding protein [Arachnia sp.]